MTEPLTITILEGDETGQELLEQALRVLAPDVVGCRSSSTATTSRSRTGARPATRSSRRRRAAMRASGLGIKAATITPEGEDDVGSPNRHRARGRRRQGHRPHRPPHPRRRRRSAARTTRSPSSAWPSTTPTAPSSGARASPARRRDRLPHREDHALDLPRGRRVRVPDRRSSWAARSTAGRSGRSRPSTRACSRRRWTPRPRAIPTCVPAGADRRDLRRADLRRRRTRRW